MALTKIGKEGVTGISNSSDATAITISSDELVGIGETSPSSALHVKGGAGANIAIQSTAGNHWRIGDGVGDSNSVFVIRDHTNSANRVRITNSGDFWIGAGNYTSAGARFYQSSSNVMRFDQIKTASGDLLVTCFITMGRMLVVLITQIVPLVLIHPQTIA